MIFLQDEQDHRAVDPPEESEIGCLRVDMLCLVVGAHSNHVFSGNQAVCQVDEEG